MNDNYVLYGRQGGGSLAAQFLLEEIGVPYQMEWVDGIAAADPDSAYRHICPTGKIPALVLPDGSSMFESAAICIHLATVHNQAKLAPAPGSAEHARFLQWMLFLTTSVYGSALRIYYASRYTKHADGEGVKAAALAEFESHLALIDSQLKSFMLGESLSAADFYLYMLAGWHPDGLDSAKFPKITALCDIIGARPAVQRVMAVNG